MYGQLRGTGVLDDRLGPVDTGPGRFLATPDESVWCPAGGCTMGREPGYTCFGGRRVM